MACPLAGKSQRMTLAFHCTTSPLARIYKEANREKEESLPKAVLKLRMIRQQA